MKHPASTIKHGRQFATAVDGTVITFRCKREGHTYKVNFASKRRRLTARLSAGACKMMASWWSEAKGGCIGRCPKCERDCQKSTSPTSTKHEHEGDLVAAADSAAKKIDTTDCSE